MSNANLPEIPVVVPATLAHIPGVIEIAQDCGLSTWADSAYYDEVGRHDSIFLVAVRGSRPIGFVMGRTVPSSLVEARYDTEIHNIALYSNFRRSGIGTALLDEIKKRAKNLNVHQLWLEVRKQNIGAIAFYEGHGFVYQQLRRNFYSDPPDDAIVMRSIL